MGQWGYDLSMWAAGVVSFALALWLFRSTGRAKGKGRGLRVVTLGMFLQGAGLVLGATSLAEFLGRATWEYMGLGFLIGSMVGRWAAAQQVKKWDRALQAEGALPERVKKWWSSGAFVSALLLAILLVGLWGPPNLLPEPPTAALVAVCFGIPGLFVAYGLSVSTWASRKEREGFAPLVIPTSKGE